MSVRTMLVKLMKMNKIWEQNLLKSNFNNLNGWLSEYHFDCYIRVFAIIILYCWVSIPYQIWYTYSTFTDSISGWLSSVDKFPWCGELRWFHGLIFLQHILYTHIWHDFWRIKLSFFIIFKPDACWPQACALQQVHAWFLKINSVWTYVCLCVCMCVCLPCGY